MNKEARRKDMEKIVLNYTKDNAVSCLCQAMFDETIRLRKASLLERNSIRNFLIEAFQSISENNPDISHQGEFPDGKTQCNDKEKKTRQGGEKSIEQ